MPGDLLSVWIVSFSSLMCSCKFNPKYHKNAIISYTIITNKNKLSIRPEIINLIRNQIVRAESTFHNFRHFWHFRHSQKEALRSIIYMAIFMHTFVGKAKNFYPIITPTHILRLLWRGFRWYRTAERNYPQALPANRFRCSPKLCPGRRRR